MSDWCESKGYKNGIVDGWPGEYWLEKVPNVPDIKPKKENGKIVTIKEQVDELYTKYSDQCIESHHMMDYVSKRKIKVNGLNSILANSAGINRTKCYRLQQSVGLHKNTFIK